MRMRWIAAALATLLVAAPAASAGPTLTILTGGVDGVYFPLGIAIAKIFSDNIPERTAQVQVSKGSVENLKLVAEGRGELAFTLGDTLKAAVEGDAGAGFKERLTKLRAVGALYPNYVQIVATAKSGIKTLADLKGKSLSVGAPQSGTDLNARAILQAAGLDENDIGKIKPLSFAESVTQMKDGKLDATLQSAGLGVSSLNELSNSGDIVMVPVPRDLVEKIGPPFMAATIPASTYRGQSRDIPTAAVMNYLVTSSDVADEIAYQMTKLVFDRLPELAKAHPAAGDIMLERAMLGSPAPLHPGALRYYEGKGLVK